MFIEFSLSIADMLIMDASLGALKLPIQYPDLLVIVHSSCSKLFPNITIDRDSSFVLNKFKLRAWTMTLIVSFGATCF